MKKPLLRNHLQAVVWPLILMPLMASCTTSSGPPQRLNINSEIPAPVVEKLPLHVAVVHGPDVINFVTLEAPSRGRPYEISLGGTHRKIIQIVINGLFDQISEYPSLNAYARSGDQVDVVLVTSVDDYSMLTASEAGSKFYSVSMRHFVDIHHPDRKHALRLDVNSYGRSVKELFEASKNIDSATDDAFRDLSVTLLVELPEKLRELGFIEEKGN